MPWPDTSTHLPQGTVSASPQRCCHNRLVALGLLVAHGNVECVCETPRERRLRCSAAGHAPSRSTSVGRCWLPATTSMALVCTHSPLCQVPGILSPCAETKRSHKLCLSPHSALESCMRPMGWRPAMGLLALRRWSCAKEPGWGFLGSQKRLSPRQLLVPTDRFNSQRDPRGWALPLPAPVWGSSGSRCLQKVVMS